VLRSAGKQKGKTLKKKNELCTSCSFTVRLQNPKKKTQQIT
jgi:hypothetical protein